MRRRLSQQCVTWPKSGSLPDIHAQLPLALSWEKSLFVVEMLAFGCKYVICGGLHPKKRRIDSDCKRKQRRSRMCVCARVCAYLCVREAIFDKAERTDGKRHIQCYAHVALERGEHANNAERSRHRENLFLQFPLCLHPPSVA